MKENNPKAFGEIFDDLSYKCTDYTLTEPVFSDVLQLCKEIMEKRLQPWFREMYRLVPRHVSRESESCLFFRLILHFDLSEAFQTFLDSFSLPRVLLCKKLIDQKSKRCLTTFLKRYANKYEQQVCLYALEKADEDMLTHLLPSIKKIYIAREHCASLLALRFLYKHGYISKNVHRIFDWFNDKTSVEVMKFLVEEVQLDCTMLSYELNFRKLSMPCTEYVYQCLAKEEDKLNYAHKVFSRYCMEGMVMIDMDMLQFCIQRGVFVSPSFLSRHLFTINHKGRFISQRFWCKSEKETTIYYHDTFWRDFFIQNKDQFALKSKKVIETCQERLIKLREKIATGLHAYLCKDVISVICNFF